MRRHDRSSSSSSSSSFLSSPSSAHTSYLPSSRNTGYGLLQPQPVSISSLSLVESRPTQHSQIYGNPQRPRISSILSARRQHRKTSSFGASVGLPAVSVPAWSEVEAGLGDLRDKSYELGAGIGELGGQLCEKLPAVRAGVAFISTLRSNLQLSSSLHPPSPYLHPISPSPVPSPIPRLSKYTNFVTMPSPSREREEEEEEEEGVPSTSTTSPLDSIPPLSYIPAVSQGNRTTGLRLIADSVAQKRQSAAASLIFSPVSLAILLAVLAALYAKMYTSRSDAPLLFTTSAGIGMAYLLAVRWAVGGYISYAETVTWKWLGHDDVVLAVFGDAVIGAASYRVVEEPCSPPPGSARSSPRKKATQKVAIVRAWTIRRRERGTGVGRGLLEDVVARCLGEKGCVDVRFATAEEERAGSKQVLPKWLAGPTGVDVVLRKEEERAQATLRRILAATKKK